MKKINSGKDIECMEDIQLLVDSFYGDIRNDDLLGPIFKAIIRDRWPEHLEKMYRFWQTVLLGDHTYFGSPFPPHAAMPLEQHHFNTWLALWHGTVDRDFTGPVADEAKWRGDKMAALFLSKIEFLRNSNTTSLI